MLRTIRSAAVITLAAAGLLVAGCVADGATEPYSLTEAALLDEPDRREKHRWTDQKGRYRPELRAPGAAPLR